MSDFMYKESRKRILDILDSKTKIENCDTIPKNEDDLNFKNGIRSWVGAIFVDIVDSSSLFKSGEEEKVARIMRAFSSEIIGILESDKNYRQIGIRGDCVYAIYSAPNKEDLERILDNAVLINTFQKMFNKVLEQKHFPTFKIGIGLGASEDLVIKAGKKGTGINDNIWIGSAVVNASNLSSEGSRSNNSPIIMDGTFYYNIKDVKVNEKYCYSDYVTKKKLYMGV